jgi:hypothetical protein
MTAAAVVSPECWPFSPHCFIPSDTTIHIEDRLLPFILYLFTLLVCLRCSPLSPFFSFAAAIRDIADALDYENLSSRIWSNVEKNVSRCLL